MNRGNDVLLQVKQNVECLVDKTNGISVAIIMVV